MKEQVIELAKQAGFQKFLKPADRPEMICDPDAIERFYALVRNAALEEAAQKCRSATASIWDYHEDGRKEIGTTVCNNLAASIESLKEPTP